MTKSLFLIVTFQIISKAKYVFLPIIDTRSQSCRWHIHSCKEKTGKHTQCFKILLWAYNRSKCTFHRQKTNVMIHYPLPFLRSTDKSLISSAMSLNQTYCYSLLIFLSLHSVSSEADLCSLFLQFNLAL